MKRTKFTDSQIIDLLKSQEQGKKVGDICREHGISQPKFYQCRSKFSAVVVNQLKHEEDLAR